jgi:hypothetical protein
MFLNLAPKSEQCISPSCNPFFFQQAPELCLVYLGASASCTCTIIFFLFFLFSITVCVQLHQAYKARRDENVQSLIVLFQCPQRRIHGEKSKEYQLVLCALYMCFAGTRIHYRYLCTLTIRLLLCVVFFRFFFFQRFWLVGERERLAGRTRPGEESMLL